MKKLRSLLYSVFAVIGLSLLVSKLVSRVFGLKEVLMADTRLLIGYELAIGLLVSLGVCWAKSPDRSSRKAPQESAISDLRSKLGKAAIVLRSTPASGPIEGHVSCLGRVTWQQPGEKCPVDTEGKPLDPLATLFVPDLPGVPEALRKEDFPADFSSPAGRHAVYETHKIGGYPTYAQGDPEMPQDYPFVMPHNYDSDAGLEIGDCGSYYFYYNAEENAWRVYSDCY